MLRVCVAVCVGVLFLVGEAVADTSTSSTETSSHHVSQSAPRRHNVGSQSPFANVHHRSNTGGQTASNVRAGTQSTQRVSSSATRVNPRRNVGSQSPFANIHHRDVPSQRHTSSVTTITPREDQTVITWPGGFIIPGERGWRHPRGRVWVSGRYEMRYQQVYVPGYWTRQYVPPTYEPRRVNGQVVNVMVSPGYYENVYVPGRYETQPVRVYVPGHWR